jgi:hypothetical protein
VKDRTSGCDVEGRGEGVLAIKHHPPHERKTQRHLVWGEGIVFVFLLIHSRPSLASSRSPQRRAKSCKGRLVAAAAGQTVAEAAGAVGNLLLLDGNNVDGDAVELSWLSDAVSLKCGVGEHTPMDLRRSLVSWSTSSMPLSLFWVKSRAETSGTYWSLRSRSSSWSLKEIPRTGPR